jgi:hypothetical protein
VQRKATHQQATQNLNYNMEQAVKIMAEPVKIISTDPGSEWMSKANKLWQEEFSHVDFLVTREVKTEWQSIIATTKNYSSPLKRRKSPSKCETSSLVNFAPSKPFKDRVTSTG